MPRRPWWERLIGPWIVLSFLLSIAFIVAAGLLFVRLWPLIQRISELVGLG